MKKFKEQLLKFAVFIFDILLSISISGCNTENYSARKNQKIVPQDYSDVAKNTPSGTPGLDKPDENIGNNSNDNCTNVDTSISSGYYLS